MKFALIGASKTGTSIAYHLWKNGHNPIFLWNRSEANLSRTLKFVPFKTTAIDITAVPGTCDFIIFSVSDDALQEVVSNFLATHQHCSANMFHTSGALDASVFENYPQAGSFHPVISIPNIEEGIKLLPKTTFTCEGQIADELVSMATDIGKTGIKLTAEQKKYIHLSAVFLNNYLAGLIEKIKLMNRETGLTDSRTQAILDGITNQTVASSWQTNIEDSLTDPVRRGDIKTIKKHLAILDNDDLFRQLYKNFGKILLNLVNQDIEKTELLEELFKFDINER